MNKTTIKSAAKFDTFYGHPLYTEGDPKPDCYDLFNWAPWQSSGGKPIYYGTLKEESFDTIDKKIAYLSGILEDTRYNRGIINGDSYITFTNSNDKVERCKNWINLVANHMNMNTGKGRDGQFIISGIIRHEIIYNIPICHRLEIHPDVIKFILENSL